MFLRCTPLCSYLKSFLGSKLVHMECVINNRRHHLLNKKFYSDIHQLLIPFRFLWKVLDQSVFFENVRCNPYCLKKTKFCVLPYCHSFWKLMVAEAVFSWVHVWFDSELGESKHKVPPLELKLLKTNAELWCPGWVLTVKLEDHQVMTCCKSFEISILLTCSWDCLSFNCSEVIHLELEIDRRWFKSLLDSVITQSVRIKMYVTETWEVNCIDLQCSSSVA